MQFGTGILIKWALPKGGYTSCRFLVMKNTLICSKNLGPKRSLNARLGHSKRKTNPPQELFWPQLGAMKSQVPE